VKGFTRSGDLRLDNGWVISREFGHLHHGYAVTSHASQGKSVDHVLVAMNATSAMAAGSAEQAYVSISRGRLGVTIYTDSREAVLEAAKVIAARPSAHDLAAKESLRKASRNRIGRALREQAMRLRRAREYEDQCREAARPKRAETAKAARTPKTPPRRDTSIRPVISQRKGYSL
jgi:hypothetical protein